MTWPDQQPSWKAWLCPTCHRRYDDSTPGPGCDRCNPTPPEQTVTPLTDIAQAVCTPAELDVLHLHAAGMGRRRGAHMLGITEDAWRWRLATALRKITRHQEAAA